MNDESEELKRTGDKEFQHTLPSPAGKPIKKYILDFPWSFYMILHDFT